MAIGHAAANWFAGDDWEINATLLDENLNPIDLSAATIKWALLNANHQLALDEADAAIVITNAMAGQCRIVVSAASTSPLPGGKYSDAIRIIVGGITSTLSVGPILVTANPWTAVVAPVAALEEPRLRLATSA